MRCSLHGMIVSWERWDWREYKYVGGDRHKYDSGWIQKRPFRNNTLRHYNCQKKALSRQNPRQPSWHFGPPSYSSGWNLKWVSSRLRTLTAPTTWQPTTWHNLTTHVLAILHLSVSRKFQLQNHFRSILQKYKLCHFQRNTKIYYKNAFLFNNINIYIYFFGFFRKTFLKNRFAEGIKSKWTCI